MGMAMTDLIFTFYFVSIGSGLLFWTLLVYKLDTYFEHYFALTGPTPFPALVPALDLGVFRFPVELLKETTLLCLIPLQGCSCGLGLDLI